LINTTTGVVEGHTTQTLYGKRTWSGRCTSPLLFAGQYEDAESGWAYNRFRYYNPTLGAYNAQDPLGLAPRLASAQGYVDHAAFWVDMLGLKGCWADANKVKDHYVYHYVNGGKTTYVGITKHPRMRAIQHAITHPTTRPIGGMRVLNRDNPLGKYEARGVEQHLIERLRMSNPPKVTQAEYKDLGLENGLLENKINSMSKNHRFYKEGTEFGKEWIENNYPNIK
ncbi:RHS repeat-associated core domain-containing protein, partial [Corynebacterium macclintockiae]|uniref:RHS repeat-associated core domain-containing protein n=1 Tax=Corynebacterium macclintockiae TaxID=2913501 RepID=UPI003EBC7312